MTATPPADGLAVRIWSVLLLAGGDGGRGRVVAGGEGRAGWQPARQDDGDGAFGDGVRSDVLGTEVGERALRPRRRSEWWPLLRRRTPPRCCNRSRRCHRGIAYTRTGHAGVAVVDAEGVLGIRYRHRTSRALDPQLHDHVLISNAVRTVSDGEWRTLDARGLYRQAKAAGVEYQTHLRAGLRGSLGVEFGDVDANGQADIVGIDDTVLVEFSTRSVDIETELENWVSGFVEREGRQPSAVEVGKAHKTITLATRTAKPADAGLPTATLRAGWRERADSIVNVERMLTVVLGEPSPPAVSRPSVEEVLDAVETQACTVGRGAVARRDRRPRHRSRPGHDRRGHRRGACRGDGIVRCRRPRLHPPRMVIGCEHPMADRCMSHRRRSATRPAAISSVRSRSSSGPPHPTPDSTVP